MTAAEMVWWTPPPSDFTREHVFSDAQKRPEAEASGPSFTGKEKRVYASSPRTKRLKSTTLISPPRFFATSAVYSATV